MHHRNARSERGFTLIELMIVIAMIFLVLGVGVYAVLTKTILMGNQWVTEESALKCVQFVEPTITRVVRLERHSWSRSVVITADEKGTRTRFLLDADVLFNADCEPTVGPHHE